MESDPAYSRPPSAPVEIDVEVMDALAAGGTPATFIRHLNKGWRQLMEDCGVVEVASIEARSAKVLLRELPDVCIASRAWIEALRPGMRTLYELVGTSGDVDVTMRGRDVELHFNW